MRPIVPRRSARKDVEIAVDYYAREAGAQIALSFIDALESTYTLLAEHPASGSLRYAYELGLPGLRSRALKGYPYMVFYLEQADHVDVWRVLHVKQDIPVWLQDPEAPSA
ncbi:type II toxin-antitoxin system RelE/ParE family toxin [Rhizobium redzepovicii]|uniref:Type II toxin-antitoxin system RelE/ParE family toxin n=1 Tax=Rhizobium redzepovicii TaxID=2867518 RepID=A0AAW8PCK5_9HYPH|nr:type II toxin-antitoxin system RelE/ParE family toxin [Rhizobium redzepovicii]MDR9764181.1 type II toxin-antitoxin system RelE/ParE family toxin [Rhizobium redzepovicii]MDR9781097.1 type II toxin-antitoxin system RelE/ParE family toxin [Rhizobium redzepovicii]